MGTRIRTHITPKMRIISFVLAFVMVFVGLPYVGIEASAVKYTIDASTRFSGLIHRGQTGSTQHIGEGVTKVNGDIFNYEYTGRVKSSSVKLYDYKTDGEVAGTGINMGDGGGGYYDPYTGFNTAISNSIVANSHTIPGRENITINYKSSYFSQGDHVNIYLWDSTDSTKKRKMEWPGEKMEYDTVNEQFTYTLKVDNLGFSPDRVIFNSDSVQTDDIVSTAMTAGHTYLFQDSSNVYITLNSSEANASPIVYLWNGINNNGSGDTMSYEKYDNNRYFYTFSYTGMSWLPNNFKTMNEQI